MVNPVLTSAGFFFGINQKCKKPSKQKYLKSRGNIGHIGNKTLKHSKINKIVITYLCLICAFSVTYFHVCFVGKIFCYLCAFCALKK